MWAEQAEGGALGGHWDAAIMGCELPSGYLT